MAYPENKKAGGTMTDLTGTAALIALRKAGGGGGSLITKTIETNGVYRASDDHAAGYSQVTVDVSEDTEYGYFTHNGVYNPTEGKGFYSVEVDVDVENTVDIRSGTPVNDITKIACPDARIYDDVMDFSVGVVLLNVWQVAVYTYDSEGSSSFEGRGYILQGGVVRPNQTWIESWSIDSANQTVTVIANFNTTGYDYVVPYDHCQLPADHLVPGTANHYHYDRGEFIIGTITVPVSSLYDSDTGEYFGDSSHQMQLVN
jgi:hypothetical protein